MHQLIFPSSVLIIILQTWPNHLQAWKELCTPRRKGGLGFKTTKSTNKAPLAKLAWMIASKLWYYMYENSKIEIQGSAWLSIRRITWAEEVFHLIPSAFYVDKKMKQANIYSSKPCSMSNMVLKLLGLQIGRVSNHGLWGHH